MRAEGERDEESCRRYRQHSEGAAERPGQGEASGIRYERPVHASVCTGVVLPSAFPRSL